MPAKPERTCIACRTKRPQSEFVRVSRKPDGALDIGRHKLGRGAYFCLDARCIEAGLKKDRLGRALRGPIAPTELDRISKELFCNLR